MELRSKYDPVQAAYAQMTKPKDKPPFDLMQMYGRFSANRGFAMTDPETKAAFGQHVGEQLDRGLGMAALLQGQRVESMFEALMIALGRCRMIKAEDGGKVWPESDFRVPDFRLVLEDGEQWLVEVKNVYCEDAGEQRKKIMTAAYRRPMETYAKATGAELKLAVFWARWSIWTLVTPSRLVADSEDLELDMITAITVNELSALGDEGISTCGPLRMRLTANPDKPHFIDEDGVAQFIVGKVQVFSQDRELVDPIDQQIAWILMNFGQWSMDGPIAIMDEERLLGVDFVHEPEEAHAQGFDLVGTLSRMFARYYANHTLEERAVVRLAAPPNPDLFAPFREIGNSDALPLWRTRVAPNYDLFAKPVADGSQIDQEGK